MGRREVLCRAVMTEFGKIRAQIARQIRGLDRARHCGQRAIVEFRERSFEPEGEGRVALDHGRAGDGHHAGRTGALALPERRLTVGHERVAFIDHDEGKLLRRRRMARTLDDLHQGADPEKLRF